MDNKVYVLVGPTLVDLKTYNAFRGPLRLVFEPVAPAARFSYNQLENIGRRAARLTESLEAREIVEPNNIRRQIVSDVKESQREITSF